MDNKKNKVWKLNPETLPLLPDVEDKLKEILSLIYEDDYSRFVLEQGKGTYSIITKGYMYFSPIVLSIVSHPDDTNRVLFINVSRRIPISSEEEFVRLSSELGDMFALEFEEIKRKYGDEEDKVFNLKFANVSAKIHALSLRDSAWFLMVLSKLIKIDNILLGTRPSKYDDQYPKSEDKKSELEFT